MREEQEEKEVVKMKMRGVKKREGEKSMVCEMFVTFDYYLC